MTMYGDGNLDGDYNGVIVVDYDDPIIASYFHFTYIYNIYFSGDSSSSCANS